MMIELNFLIFKLLSDKYLANAITIKILDQYINNINLNYLIEVI